MRKKYTFGALLLFLVLICTYIIRRPHSTSEQVAQAKHPLLAKRIFIDNPSETIINFTSLRSDLANYFNSNNLQGTLYFEYLPTGTSIREGDDKEELVASLLKVPIAMELYKSAELGKIDLDAKTSIKKEWLDDQFGDLYKKGAGYSLTLRDATKIMLEESDNTALKTIAYSNVDKLSPDQTAFTALDVDYTLNSDQTVSLDARSYSSILKCLYFACYLNENDSQELLKYLTQSAFDDRLVAGVSDKSLTIAHKIGVADTETQSDCGIFYIPNRNYLLCVILKGNDSERTNQHIATLSQYVYKYLKK